MSIKSVMYLIAINMILSTALFLPHHLFAAARHPLLRGYFSSQALLFDKLKLLCHRHSSFYYPLCALG